MLLVCTYVHMQYTISILTFVSSVVLHWLKGMIAGRSLSTSTIGGNFTAAAMAIYRITMYSA